MKKHTPIISLIIAGLLACSPIAHAAKLTQLTEKAWWQQKASNAGQWLKDQATWAQEKARALGKENQLKNLVKFYQDTKELRQKRAEGTASQQELDILDQRMKKLETGALAIGIPVASVIAFATVAIGGTALGAWLYSRSGEEPVDLPQLTEQGETERYQDQTALHKAIHNLTMLQMLLRKNINPNVQDNTGSTPLHNAVSGNLYSSVKTLLDYGANPNIKNDDGQTPLDIAIKLNNQQIIRILEDNDAQSGSGLL